MDVPQLGAADTQISVPSAEKRELPKALSSLGKNPNITLCALSTVGKFA